MVREKNPGMEDLTAKKLEGYVLSYREMKQEDFEHAFGKVKPASKAEDIEKFGKWGSESG
jgi:hypothetical protein